MKITNRTAMFAIAVTTLTSALPHCAAQTTPALPAHQYVQMIHLKPDMLTEWLDLQKNEVVPAQKKGGLPSRITYQTLRGNPYEYVIVIPFDKYALFDTESPQLKALGAAGSARLAAKLRKCIESEQAFVSSPVAEASFLPDGEAPLIAVYTRVRVASGKMQEYQNFLKTEVLPLYKKANVRYTVVRRGLGANTNDLTQVSSVGDKYADLDKGSVLTRALGADGTARLLAKTAGMATLIEQVVRRRLPDLSY
jgi:hypothetical protein